MKHKTRGKGEWNIVKITPADIMEMASTIVLQMSKGEKIENYYFNETLDDKFQIRVEL
jgi:hypothetical protein